MPAWHDQFATPCLETLTAEIDPQHAPAWAAIQKRIGGLEGLTEDLKWMGIPWRWTITFKDGARDVVHLIPDPDAPRLAIPIAVEQITGLDTKKLPRTVRDGLARARVVGGIAWAEWEVTSQAAATDLGKFLAKLERELASV